MIKSIINKIRLLIKRLSAEDGFTLLEIMIVVTIIAVLMGVVGVNLFNSMEKGKVTAAKMQIKNFETAILQYNGGNPPATEEGLQALVNDGLIKNIPKDPWGNEYQYRSPGENDNAFEIWSFGKAGLLVDKRVGDVVHRQLGNQVAVRAAQRKTHRRAQGEPVAVDLAGMVEVVVLRLQGQVRAVPTAR